MADKVKVTIPDGFSADVDTAVFDGMDFVDLLSEAEEGNPLAVPRLLNTLIGKEQKKALYEFYRDSSGKVPVDKVTAALGELMQGCKDGKKS